MSRKNIEIEFLDKNSRDLIFNEARTYNGWQDKEVSNETLKELYNLLKMAPTGANCCPARFTFLTSDSAKQRLKPHLAEGNVDKTMAAPVVTIVSTDFEFYEHLPKLFPHADAKSWYVGNDAMIDSTANLNGSLQGAYLIMAARAVGLDCGPMGGFEKDGVQKEFFADQPNVKPNFLCNLGYGDVESLFPRSPRFKFDEACDIL